MADLAGRGDVPIREIHVVGGLNPELPLAYYVDMLRGIARQCPQAGIKGLHRRGGGPSGRHARGLGVRDSGRPQGGRGS